MSQRSNYAQLLRPIGQMLEGLGIESFALRLEGEDFLVHGRKKIEQPPSPPPEKTLRVVWRLLRGTPPESKQNSNPSSGVIELRYTPDAIAQMDSAGKAKRAGSGTPAEPHALSQILRAVGAFVDQKEGQLLGITKDEENITVEYRSDVVDDTRQEFTIASLYDYWIKMYLKRKTRT